MLRRDKKLDIFFEKISGPVFAWAKGLAPPSLVPTPVLAHPCHTEFVTSTLSWAVELKAVLP